MSSKQITMVCFDQLVSTKHQYRKFKDLFDFTAASEELKPIESPENYKGYGILCFFKCLLFKIRNCSAIAQYKDKIYNIYN